MIYDGIILPEKGWTAPIIDTDYYWEVGHGLYQMMPGWLWIIRSNGLQAAVQHVELARRHHIQTSYTLHDTQKRLGAGNEVICFMRFQPLLIRYPFHSLVSKFKVLR